jgi:NAD(P)-dependent dehydrogenase (short-subunit alcohol dehydrogenase family)
MKSEKRVALVTGAGRGIGLGIAKALAAEGCNIVIGDVHDPDVVKGAVSELEALGAQVLYCRADVSSAEARVAMLDGIKETFGRLDILINNAGVGPKVRADILDATEESFEWVMKINLQGPYFLTQAVARYMIEQKKADDGFAGCVVNISSISADVASVSRGEYCLSKAGVSMATKLFASRLGEFNIPVYEIRPGLILTDMTSVVKEKYDKMIAEGICVQARWGLPDDIGRAVAMMARGDIGYSTGQVINIDGGMSVQRL